MQHSRLGLSRFFRSADVTAPDTVGRTATTPITTQTPAFTEATTLTLEAAGTVACISVTMVMRGTTLAVRSPITAASATAALATGLAAVPVLQDSEAATLEAESVMVAATEWEDTGRGDGGCAAPGEADGLFRAH
jgi:hypothetical protein